MSAPSRIGSIMSLMTILVLLIIMGCRNGNQSCEPMNAMEVKQMMVDFLHAANHHEFDRLEELTTTEFTCYGEEGEWDYDRSVEFDMEWSEPDEFDLDRASSFS